MFILFTTLVVISGLIRLGSSTPIPEQQDCTRPDDSTLCTQWLLAISSDQETFGHESYYSIPSYRSLIEVPLTDNSSISHFNGDQDISHCSLDYISGKSDLRDRSICPWYHVQNVDNNRYPRVLIEARCRCPYAAGQGSRSACHLVYSTIRVLRGECQDGEYTYSPGWQHIAVGCTATQEIF